MYLVNKYISKINFFVYKQLRPFTTVSLDTHLLFHIHVFFYPVNRRVVNVSSFKHLSKTTLDFLNKEYLRITLQV